MPKNIKIDLDKKQIKVNSEMDVKTLYSEIMDIFDEPEYMRYDIPIESLSDSKFKLINGWSLDKKSSVKFIGFLQED